MISTEFYLTWKPLGSVSTIPITEQQNRDIGSYKRIKFKLFTFPITYYGVSNINNTVQLSENGGAWNTMVLENSNYDDIEFVAELKRKLDAVGAGTYTVTISKYTGKLTITAVNITNFSIRFTASSKQHEKIWGVIAGTSRPQIPATLSYTSPNVIQLWGPDQLNVVSSTLSKMITKKNIDVVGEISDIILKVPVTLNAFNQESHYESDWMPAVNQEMIPSSILIDIVDEEGNSLNFNGGTCYLTVSIST
jgi:hypothetical protein